MKDMFGNDLRKTDSFGTPRDEWADLVRCRVCGSDNVDGSPIGAGVEMPDPVDEDNVLIGYSVVAFVCLACGARWVDDDSTDPANGAGQSEQGDQ